MDPEAISLLPGHAELARRAAGGDGAAFVRLYDDHAADVFGAVLAESGSVDVATHATQDAFLRLLHRPPALASPDPEVADRLVALALHSAGADPSGIDAPLPGRRFEHTGVGWLRSETVAKAGARFDEDWGAHLAS